METLTKKEEEIMQIFWDVKEGFVKDIISKLPEPKPPYNTISSVVRILEKKGFLGFRSFGKSHQYFPIIEKKTYRKYAFKTMLKGYFEGSYKNVISYLVNNEDLSEKDIEEISKLQEILKKKIGGGS
jgi:predicted transcriptional regulator